ncbi:MAG: hypothetical protein GY835_24980 [bacterium]|nr:hypothetical protein [bacterium]
MRDFTKAVLLLVVGAAIGYWVEGYRSRAQNRIRFLDQEIRTSKSVLSLPALPGQKLEVLLNGSKIGHMTKVTVTLHNWEDKDFIDVPVYITLRPKGGEELKVITKDAYIGDKKARDGVSELRQVKSPLKAESRKFGFKIHTANRSSFREGYAEMLFYLEGVVEPEVDVSINKSGLCLRPLDYEHYNKRNADSEKLLIVAVPVAAFVLPICGLYWIVQFARRHEARRRTANLDAMIEAIRTKSVAAPDEQTARDLLYELARIEYERLSAVDKWLTIEPDRAAFMGPGPTQAGED